MMCACMCLYVYVVCVWCHVCGMVCMYMSMCVYVSVCVYCVYVVCHVYVWCGVCMRVCVKETGSCNQSPEVENFHL